MIPSRSDSTLPLAVSVEADSHPFPPADSTVASPERAASDNTGRWWNGLAARLGQRNRKDPFHATPAGGEDVSSDTRAPILYKDRDRHTDRPCSYKNPARLSGASRLGPLRFRHPCPLRPFPCLVEGCPKWFSQTGNRNVHMRTHSGYKPFACLQEGCGKTFAHKGNRNTHMRTHTGRKTFACTEQDCKKSFPDRTRLQVHLQAHARKAARCPDTSRPLKKRHKETGNRPAPLEPLPGTQVFLCPLADCQTLCAGRALLTRHLRGHIAKPLRVRRPGPARGARAARNRADLLQEPETGLRRQAPSAGPEFLVAWLARIRTRGTHWPPAPSRPPDSASAVFGAPAPWPPLHGPTRPRHPGYRSHGPAPGSGHCSQVMLQKHPGTQTPRESGAQAGEQ